MTAARSSAQLLTLVGKPDCHLCHEMREVVESVLLGGERLAEAEVTSRPDWERRYLFDIPVLLWGDVEVARHRVTASELKLRLDAIGFRGPRTP